jgi:hypothetical protein
LRALQADEFWFIRLKRRCQKTQTCNDGCAGGSALDFQRHVATAATVICIRSASPPSLDAPSTAKDRENRRKLAFDA